MAKFTLNGYDSYSGCDILVTARINSLTGTAKALAEKTYVLGSLQTISISTHQDRKPVRVIGSVNALDYVMGQRTIAGSLVFAVFDKHFATEMFNDLRKSTGKTFLMPDELPGLDLTLTFANEYGRESRMAIYGVKFINEGQVMSINDLYTENTYQFVATAMEPLRQEDGANSSNNRDIPSQIVSSNRYNTPDNYNNSINRYHSSNYPGFMNNGLVHNAFINQEMIGGAVSDGSSIQQGAVNGGTLYDKDNIENITIQYFNVVSLIASVEQPIAYKQDGIVLLYLSPIQSRGSISIYDKKQDKVIADIIVNNKSNQYSIYLSAGEYSAWYYDEDKILSNTVYFTINEVFNVANSYNDAPIIESVTHNSITAIANNPAHTTGVCVDLETLQECESDINSRVFKFTDLDSNKYYMLYTKNDNAISKSTKTKTLQEKNIALNIYKDYVINNQKTLSKSFDKYELILNKLTDDNFLYTLLKDKTPESKELIYMAIKYQNELTTIFNDNYENMATKHIDSVYGNTFEFKSGVARANIFWNKNNKDYFEDSEAYPTEITYIGKPNSLYHVVSINDEFIKSPKYSFYAYSDNDKTTIQHQFGSVNVLNKIEPITLTNTKLSNDALLCLTAKTYKTKDINLLKAPSAYINNNNDLIANLDYRDIVGEKDTPYYLCLARLEECLDKTTFRKIETHLNNDSAIFTNILTAINKNDVYALWIEDAQYNIVSDLGFTTYTDRIEDLNSTIVEEQCKSIIKRIQNKFNQYNYLTELVTNINYENIIEKDIYKELASLLITDKESQSFNSVFELFKIQFATIYVLKNKHKKAIYNKDTKVVEFEGANNVELVHIAIKKDGYFIDIINDKKAIVDSAYDINVFYLINANPVVKSGFVIIDNDRATSHLIDLEVI